MSSNWHHLSRGKLKAIIKQYDQHDFRKDRQGNTFQWDVAKERTFREAVIERRRAKGVVYIPLAELDEARLKLARLQREKVERAGLQAWRNDRKTRDEKRRQGAISAFHRERQLALAERILTAEEPPTKTLKTTEEDNVISVIVNTTPITIIID